MKVKFGIRAKLLTFILPVVAVALILVVAVSYFDSKESIQSKTELLLESEATSAANSVEAWMANDLGILDTMANAVVDLQMTDEDLLSYGENFLESYDSFPDGIYVTTEKGEYLDPSGYVMEMDPREGDWWKEGQSHIDGFKYGNPYLDTMTKEFVVSATRYIKNFNGRAIVISADIHLSKMSEIVSELVVEGNGDAFIMNAENGAILAHADDTLLGLEAEAIEDSYYKLVFDSINSGSEAVETFKSKAGKYMTCARNIEGTSWYIVTRALQSNIYEDIYKLGSLLVVMGIVAVLAVAGVVMVIVNQTTKPIVDLTKTIQNVTNGDFTTVINAKGSDEISVMAKCMSEFLEVMRKTLGTIITISNDIDSKAQGSNAISGELYSSAEGQSESMDQLRDNLEELVQSIGAIAESATTLATVVAETNDEGSQALVNVKSTISEAEGGRTSMISVNESMIEMESGMEILERSITDVGEAAIKINEITATIRSIAEETNLLSLNASIEAARAGEAGKGFAVVATEIKTLAETSADAATEISKLIDEVTNQIDITVQQSQNSMTQIHSSADYVKAASEQFDTIFKSIEATSSIISSMIGKIANVNDVATNMAAITEEQLASAEEIEATATNMQELAGTVTDNSATVRSDSDMLAGTANNLKEEISRFQI